MLLFIGQVGADMAGREAFQEIDYDASFRVDCQMDGRDRRSQSGCLR